MGKSRALSTVGIVVAMVLLIAGGGSSSAARKNDPRIIDREEDCLEFVPEQASYVGITDDGRDIALEVLVLLDGVPQKEAAPTFELVAEAYLPLGIDILPTFRKAKSFPLTNTQVEADDVIEASKDYVGGERPPGFDVVYTITNRDITDAAGKVDCIGGIRYPTRAFGVGYYRNDEEYSDEIGPLTVLKYRTAKVATHEIAHLLGAHHHYSNCAEGDHADPSDDVGGECTVMTPDVFFVSMKFGTLESVVVRGHAVEYADQEETPNK